jgi:2-C-methyl-D-erythritol 2,4-cyclodiphosphate synthase
MIRVGIGHDTHRIGGEGPLRLGGVEILWEQGLIGHSDADVLLHAVTDAVLGAAGLGDIGEWFPDTAAEFAGADSAKLLERVVADVEGRGWRVVNADGIVFAEAPKLSAYKSQIEQRIARLLRVAADAVNIKAKTGEKVGPIGRQEAMSAEVVVLIKRSSTTRKAARRTLRERVPRRSVTGRLRRRLQLVPQMPIPQGDDPPGTAPTLPGETN